MYAMQITCGSLLKLQHVGTGVNLHSHEIAYGSGSGQQSVTGFTGGDDANDYWAVKAAVVSLAPPLHLASQAAHRSQSSAQGLECHQGTPITSGSKIRLYHTTTQKWLHSHHFSSPLTNNQEVRPLF